MGKLYTPTPISNIYSSVNTINQNWDDIADALDLTLARNGSTPNQMEALIDMNSNDIINAGSVYMDQLFVDGAQIPSLQEIGETYADMLVALAAGEAAQLAAEAAQAGAETAETNAVAAQTAAETAQTAAELAETNAEASETAAALSETNAAASESAASTSASNAATSESNAATSETNAAASASAAATSESNAASSEANAASSADLSEDWAVTPEDTEVPGNPGEYSSLHWAAKAQQAAGSSNLPLITTGDAYKVAMVNSGETAYELVDFSGPSVTGFSNLGTTEFGGGFGDIRPNIVDLAAEGVRTTFGPTGSGADVILSELDVFPLSVKAFVGYLDLLFTPNAIGDTSLQVEFYDTASPLAKNRFYATTDEVGEIFNNVTGTHVVPVDSANIFQAMWNQTNVDLVSILPQARFVITGFRY